MLLQVLWLVAVTTVTNASKVQRTNGWDLKSRGRSNWDLPRERGVKAELSYLQTPNSCSTLEAALLCRGGSDKDAASKTHAKASIGAVVWGSPSLLQLPQPAQWLFGGTSEKSATIWLYGDHQNSPLYQISPTSACDRTSLVASVGLLSDVLVVALPSGENVDDESWETLAEVLTAVAKEKKGRGLPSGKLILVAEDTSLDQNIESLKPALSEWREWKRVAPTEVVAQGWDSTSAISLLSNESGSVLSQILPFSENAEAFKTVVSQVYQQQQNEASDEAGVISFEIKAVGLPESVKAESTSSSRKQPRSGGNGKDPQDLLQAVLSAAQSRVLELETKLQEVQLESIESNQMPILDFGGMANSILNEAYDTLTSETEFPPTMLGGFLRPLVVELQRLYKDQLQSLRDYYGRRYELVLESGAGENGDNALEEQEKKWTAEAQHLTVAFQAGAAHSLPKLCQDDGPLAGLATFDSITSLNGLIQDMMEATERRKADDLVLHADDEDLNGEASSKKRRLQVPGWVRKIASRALVLGVNYLQGWLAWQGIKRAALERDREIPKFPLF